MHEKHEINYNISYFRDYLKDLDDFIYKESLSITVYDYMRLVWEIQRVRKYIEHLKHIELLEIETIYKTVKL